MPSPVASGRSDVARWALQPLESTALSRRTAISDLAHMARMGLDPNAPYGNDTERLTRK
jgi:hypothetical protein